MLSNVICPISTERIDSYVSRLTVFINVLLLIAFLVTLNPVLIIIVAIDSGIRAIGYIKYSPFAQLSKSSVHAASLTGKQIDLAPKLFASRLGFLCALAASILILAGMAPVSFAVAAFLMALSFMDSVFNFCVGCQIYHYLVLPFFSKKENDKA